MRHGVCSAPIHLHIDNELFDLVPVLWIIQAYETAAQYGHAHPHHLSRAEMTMRFGRGSQQVIERLQRFFLQGNRLYYLVDTNSGPYVKFNITEIKKKGSRNFPFLPI